MNELITQDNLDYLLLKVDKIKELDEIKGCILEHNNLRCIKGISQEDYERMLDLINEEQNSCMEEITNFFM
jgi:predicted transcriptional regulator